MLWGLHNLRVIQDHGRHSEKITVWCAVHSNSVLDPYYFDNETARGEDYHHLLNTYVRNSKSLLAPNCLFQQDGAPDYTSNHISPPS